MPRPARIYTRTGDDGTTGLVGGQRVHKSSARIDCFGVIDECSSTIGIARTALAASASDARFALLDRWLAWTQDMLFNLGSTLATLPEDRRREMPSIAQSDIDALETSIDRATDDLPPLTRFIHPGGTPAGAALHLARAVCRRAERAMAKLDNDEPVDPLVRKYVNRLSDALFVWARWANDIAGVPDHVWDPNAQPPS